MTMLRTLTWGLLATGALTLSACSEQTLAPSGRLETQMSNLSAGSIAALSPAGTSNTVMATVVSPKGWVLGYFTEGLYTPVQAQSWSPFPDYVVSTVTDIGSVRSGADEHGDVTAFSTDSPGPVVYLADQISGGAPYEVAHLPLPANAEDPGNWIARGLNDAHMVVGDHWQSGPVVWVLTAPGETTWLEPISLPLPGYPGAVNSRARGVNAAGLVVGEVRENLKREVITRAWHWRVEQESGVWTTISLGALPWASGSEDQWASDVNDAGVIVGSVRQKTGQEYPALWFPDAEGNYTEPPTVGPGPTWNTTHINRCGWTVSTMIPVKGQTGGPVAWSGSEFVSLPLMTGSYQAKAFDINDNGIVAGASLFRAKGKTPDTHVATVWRDFVPPCPR